MRILVVEDEARMAGVLQRALKEEGHAVDVVGDGPEGLWLATENQYAAIVLDVMLPGMDGFELCRRLRESGVWVPVLMLTARDGVTDRVSGLDAGADGAPGGLARTASARGHGGGKPTPAPEVRGLF